MKKVFHCILLLLIGTLSQTHAQTERIITIGPTASSIVSALGQQSAIVGVDTESHRMTGFNQIPDVGYLRNLSLESLLSLKPTQLIATDAAAPKNVIENLHHYQVNITQLKKVQKINDIYDNIKKVSLSIGGQEHVQTLLTQLKQQVTLAQNQIDGSQPNVLLLMQISPTMVHALGQGTQGDLWLHFLQADNINHFPGMRPVSRESLLALNPDIILLAINQIEQENQFQKQIDYLIQNKKSRLIAVDLEVLDSFGADFGKHYLTLAKQFYPKTT